MAIIGTIINLMSPECTAGGKGVKGLARVQGERCCSVLLHTQLVAAGIKPISFDMHLTPKGPVVAIAVLTGKSQR